MTYPGNYSGYDFFQVNPAFNQVPNYNMQPPAGWQAPSADAYKTSWQGQLSNSMPIIGGMMGFIEGWENSKALKQSERALKQAAAQAAEQGIETAMDIADEGEEVKGSMLAAFGKQGTLLEGSPLLALADTQTKIETNIARAIRQGQIEREALLFQAKQVHRQSGMAQWSGVASLVGNWGTAIARGG